MGLRQAPRRQCPLHLALKDGKPSTRSPGGAGAGQTEGWLEPRNRGGPAGFQVQGGCARLTKYVGPGQGGLVFV